MWSCHTLEELVIDKDKWQAEAVLGQWIHREVRIFFYEEPTFLNNCMSLISRVSSPAVSLGIYSRSDAIQSGRMHICI